MIFAGASNVLAESNVIHDIGRSRRGGNGLWEWLCTNCTIQNNEVYNTTDLSHNTDGGAFDIDYNNVNNIVQYNYGHDADGYCTAIFGSTDKGIPKITTTNSIVRYNICANNGRGPAHYRHFPQKADIVIKTWINSGDEPAFLNGVQIYNNTIYHNPATPVAAIQEDGQANFTGSLPSFVKNNVIYSSTLQMISTLVKSPIAFDNNLYWYTGDKGQVLFTYRGTSYEGFSDYQKGSGQEAHGIFADPLLADPTYHSVGRPMIEFGPRRRSPLLDQGADVCAGAFGCSNGGRDFLGNRISVGRVVNIGAIQIEP